MMPLKKLVAERKKLEAEVGEEVREEKKAFSVKEGAKFEKQMIKKERAKIRHLKIEKRIGKYARKGVGAVQKGKRIGKEAIQVGKKVIQTGQKAHRRTGRGLSVIQNVAQQVQDLKPPKGMGAGKKKKGKRKGGAFGFDLPF